MRLCIRAKGRIMFKFIRRALCSHNFSWSERRKGQVCARCGLLRVEQAVASHSGESHGH